jgi:hypothetical protein
MLFQHPGEKITWTADFSGVLDTGETISSLTSIVCANANAVIENETLSSPNVQFQLSGLSAGTTYVVTITVVTSINDIKKGFMAISCL